MISPTELSAHAEPSNTAQDLLEFLRTSPTPFHATENLRQLFVNSGFTELAEGEHWQCQTGQAYVVTRNDSSIIAFRLGEEIENGIQMVGAHTDSPCLKLKPNPESTNLGYTQLGIEVYGGVLLQPWFDRDLSIAGRVSGIDKKGELFNKLIDFKHAIATIPNLAIHLNREANTNNTVNPQTHLPLIIGQENNVDFKQRLLELCGDQAERILDFELSCYDTQPPAFVGLHQEFISSARLDNLLSSFISARALIESTPGKNALFVSTDHEEVGSTSACGAAGPFLRSVMERLTAGKCELSRVIDKSFLISCDNAHGIHPNYSDKHDKQHGPILNAGPAIKINANQRYASNSVSSARFQHLCDKNQVPVQHFAMRADMACGSTIGPITAGELGIETLDIGVPQWAMHSIRETAGTKDVDYLLTALTAFLS